MEQNKKLDYLVIITSLIFILVNAIFSLSNIFVINVIPVILFLLSYFLLSPTKIFFLVVLLTPLSIPLRRLIYGLDFDFWVPTEPLVFGLLLVIILKSIKERFFEIELLNHVVFWILIFYLGWLLIAIFPSESPIISIKFLMVRIWFIGVFFYFAYHLFKRNINSFRLFLWCFIIGMLVVSTITIIKHASIDLFNQKAAHGACAPFFIDHTSYGAALAFTLMMVLGLLSLEKNKLVRTILVVLSMYFLAALVLSYSRAAWLSVIFAGGVGVLWWLRIRFRTILILLVLMGGLGLIFSHEIGRWLSSNKTESSGNLKEHVNSIINVKTDASNLERLNRWSAAIRMFKERPVFGWGPGTYMFYYAPFQRSYQKTIISTNFGTGGNAHSEYLGLLSESGVPAVLTYILLLVVIVYRGIKITKDPLLKDFKIVILAAVLGICTYAVHGIMNNFLDSDKIAVPFWAFIAFIVVMDNYSRKGEKVQKSGEFKA